MSTTPFQTATWRAAAAATGRFTDATVVVERPGGEVALPALQARGPSRTVSSLPVGWGFGGVVTPGGAPTATDVRLLLAELGRRGFGTARMRPAPDQDAAFTRSGVPWSLVRENHSYEVDLSRGREAVTAAFTPAVRRAVRKAEKAGVVIERRSDVEAVEEFHRLYGLSVQRWAEGTRVPARLMQLRAMRREPVSKYHAVLAHLENDCAFWLAHHAGVVVAAVVVVSHGREHAYWRGAMDIAQAGPVRANDLLHTSAIEHACESGADRYAMGLTQPGSGLARFKSGFGAELRVSHEYAIEPAWRPGLRTSTAPVLDPLRRWALGHSGS